MFKTRKEFLKEFMRLTGLPSMREADRIAQIAIGLIKACIGPELSDRVAESVPFDLGQGWRNIAIPSEVMEVQEMMFELDEVGEEETAAARGKEFQPQYG